MGSVLLLLVVLVGAILFLIEKNEVKAIFEEHKSNGILRAKYIADMNTDNFIFYDYDSLKENLEEQVDDKLIYVIFYNRIRGEPYAGNDFILNYEDIYNEFNLMGDVKEEDVNYVQRNLKVKESGSVLSILEIEIPFFHEGSAWGLIKIGLSLEEMQAEIQRTRLILLLIGAGGLLFGFMGSIFLARRITSPLKKLVEGTVVISKGDFSQEIDINTHDEIGNLARSFNKMIHRLYISRRKEEEANRKLVQAEKLASIGRISAGLAHEIRNPLTSVKLNIQKVMESENLKGLEKDHLEISQEGIIQIEKFVKEMLNYTRVAELNLDYFSLEQIIDESEKMLSDYFKQKDVSVEVKAEKGIPPVHVDADKLRQVIVNLFRNSCEAVIKGGKIEVFLSLLNGQSGDRVKIEIFDNGPGIPKENWDSIFEPFYTTKPTGIGLGLANARKIVEQHKGTIRIEDIEGRGASFEIIIPCGEKQ
jgi:signal transduction histidine kinase